MKRLLSFLWLSLALSLTAAETDASKANLLKPLRPGEYDGLIAQVTGGLMERFHYLQKPVDDEIASRFLDRYIDFLDGQRMLLLETDIRGFEIFRTTLDDLTMRNTDVSPAHVIFRRFLERVELRHSYVMELLEKEKFEFNGQERFLINRRDATRPKDLTEARSLWRDQLRNEYLSEKLSLEKKPAETAKKNSPEAAKTGTTAKPAAPQTVHEMIVDKLKRRYGRVHDYFSKRDSDDVLQFYLSALTRSFDPHSDYMGHAEKENFDIGMRLSLFGIGAQLKDEDGYCTIVKLMPGPAMKSKKLKPDDKIVAVAQTNAEPVDVVGMKLDKVVELIRGPKGTQVRLTIIPSDAGDPSARQVVSLIRDEIKLEDQEAKATIIDLPGKDKPMRLGVIDLPSFYADFSGDNAKPRSERKSTTRDVGMLLDKLKEEKVEGMVLDLRRNGGGSLEEAVNLSGLFIKEGPIVKVRDSLGREQEDADKDPRIQYDGPLVVLTSRFSASASEILAGALQDYGRALVVGESSTHGKGTVQTLLDLGTYMKAAVPNLPFDPGSVKLTIRKFYLPSGSSTQLKGVTPDLVLPSVNNYADIGERELQNPLEWDKLKPSQFDKLDRVQPYLASLKEKSDIRVQSSKDFDYIREDIERYKKLKADRTVSLNEEVRRTELEENQARMDARKKEVQSRKEPERTVYHLTLKDAVKPGLPAPGKPVEPSDGAVPKPVEDTEAHDAAAQVPEVDVFLNEATSILADYVNLIARGPAVAKKN